MPVTSAAADEAIRQRRLVDDLAASLDKLTLFVNTFESQLKSKMAVIHARTYQLERQVGFLDRRIQAVTTDPQDKFTHDPNATTGASGLDTVHGSLGDLLSPSPYGPEVTLSSSSSSFGPPRGIAPPPAVPLLGTPPAAMPHALASLPLPTPASPPAITSLDSPPDASTATHFPLTIPVISPTHPVADPARATMAGTPGEVDSPASYVDAQTSVLTPPPPPPPPGMDLGLPPPPPPPPMDLPPLDDLPLLPPPPPPPPPPMDLPPLDDLPLLPPPPPPPAGF